MRSEALPLQIKKLCPKQWDEMSGDSKKRFCEHCQLQVHNLSAMSARESAAMVSQSAGRACIAYDLRADGSPITPARWRWLLPFRRMRWSLAALLATFLPIYLSACVATRKTLGKPAAQSDPPLQSAHKKQPVRTLGEMAPLPVGSKPKAGGS